MAVIGGGVIEHDMSLITKLADRMYGLDQGRIICEGTPEDLINHPAVVESYLGAEGYADLVGNGKRRKPRGRSPSRPARRR